MAFPEDTGLFCVPPHAVSSHRLASPSLPPPSLREGISLLGPCILLQRPLGPDRAAAGVSQDRNEKTSLSEHLLCASNYCRQYS